MFIHKLPLKGYIYSAIIISVVSALAVVLAKYNLPPVVPFFYGKPVGNGQLISTYGLLVAPGAALTIIFLNLFLASRISDEFLKKSLAIASFFVSTLSVITVVKIIFLVGFW